MQLLNRIVLAVAFAVVLTATQPLAADAQFGSPVMKRVHQKPHTGSRPPAWSPPPGHSKPPKPTRPEPTTAEPTTTAPVPAVAAAIQAVQQRWRGLRLTQ